MAGGVADTAVRYFRLTVLRPLFFRVENESTFFFAQYSLGRQLVEMVCYIISVSSSCLLGQHGSCSTAQQHVEL